MPSGTVTPAGGGAGGFTPVGVYVSLGSNQTISSGDRILVDTVETDPAGYFNAATNRLIIPAGHAGLHIIGSQVLCTGVTIATPVVILNIQNSGNDANSLTGAPRRASDSSATGAGSLLVEAAVGDTFALAPLFDGGGTITALGNQNTVLWAVRVSS